MDLNRKNIFINFYEVITKFVISITSCGCEQAFSKLSIVKFMSQKRLESFLFIFVEQKITKLVGLNIVIEEFKVLILSKENYHYIRFMFNILMYIHILL